MSNKFNIEITARDKASRVFDQMAGKANNLRRNLTAVNRTAQRGSELFRSMVPSLSAITGMGSAAGLAAMTKKFGDSSMSLSNMADNLGLSTTKLQELHAAARLSGLSVGSMDSSMKSLGNTMENATFGRDPGAMNAFRSIGIEIHKTKTGAMDTHRALLDISHYMTHHLMGKPQAQEKLASTLGVSEVLPLLRKGASGIKELEQRAERLGMVQDKASIQGGKSLYESLTEVDGAAGGLGNTIASKLAPKLKIIADGTAEWVAQNKDLIAEDVASWADGIGDAFGYAQSKGADLYEEMHKLTVAAGDKTHKDKKDPMSLNFPRAWANRYAQWATGEKDETYGDMAFDSFHAPYDPNRQKNGLTRLPNGALAIPGDHTPLGIRQNNPGNIRHWKGAYTASTGFAVFPTAKSGIEAMTANLMAYNRKYHLNTIDGIINRWAPSSDGNNTRGYIADVARHTGFAPNAQLNMSDPKTMTKLVRSMIQHENGKNPYDPAMVKSSVAQAMGQPVKVEITLHNAPNGTRAHVSSAHDASVRINHAMPGPGVP
ncbi:hypothetical protein [Halothiobacillus sp.]|uniref:hypothetical protein n=1 Tax=Halothiobacillus sp. TaxID=1891311 RepID=UPI002AD52222|nr:hypothetical protein [Halothiobacillus sp.]